MALIRRNWRAPPPDGARVNPHFGPNLDVWRPIAGDFRDVRSGAATISGSYGAVRHSPFGDELRKIGSAYFPALSITARSGADDALWIVQFGSTVSSFYSTGLLQFSNGGNGITASGGGSILLRAASTVHIDTGVSLAAGDALAFRIVSGDYRIYHRGVKYTSSALFGSYNMAAAAPYDGDSLLLAARWSGGDLPSDDVIFNLLDNPWQLLAPRQIWVPATAGAPAATFSAAHLHAGASYVGTGLTRAILPAGVGALG